LARCILREPRGAPRTRARSRTRTRTDDETTRRCLGRAHGDDSSRGERIVRAARLMNERTELSCQEHWRLVARTSQRSTKVSSTPARQPSSLEPEGSITSARLNSLPSPPLRSRVPGVALGGAALVLVFGGITGRWCARARICTKRPRESLRRSPPRRAGARSAANGRIRRRRTGAGVASYDDERVRQLRGLTASNRSGASRGSRCRDAATMPPRHVTRAHHVERPAHRPRRLGNARPRQPYEELAILPRRRPPHPRRHQPRPRP